MKKDLDIGGIVYLCDNCEESLSDPEDPSGRFEEHQQKPTSFDWYENKK